MTTTTTRNDDPLFDLAQAAEYLSINERTVRRLIAREQLACTRPSPRALRIRRSELERFLAHVTTSARP